MSRVVHFDLSADDPQRAAAFYRAVFGWPVEKWDGPTDYWLMTTGDAAQPGITGGIAKRIAPGDTAAVVFDVPSVEAAAARVVACGGSIREPVQRLPGVGLLLACRDTEGNTFCLLQPDAQLAGTGG
jgi:uncharacterized protein